MTNIGKHLSIISVLLTLCFSHCSVEEISEVTTIACENNARLVTNHLKSEKLTQIMEDAVSNGLVGVSLVLKSKEGLFFKSAGYAEY